MRENKGVTLVALVITVIVLGIIGLLIKSFKEEKNGKVFSK